MYVSFRLTRLDSGSLVAEKPYVDGERPLPGGGGRSTLFASADGLVSLTFVGAAQAPMAMAMAPHGHGAPAARVQSCDGDHVVIEFDRQQDAVWTFEQDLQTVHVWVEFTPEQSSEAAPG